MSKKKPDLILLILAIVVLVVLAPGFTKFMLGGIWAILKIALIVIAIIVILMFVFRKLKK